MLLILRNLSQVSPTIFTQVFTILGLLKRNDAQENEDNLALSLVYALLLSKESVQYATVLRAVIEKADEYGIVDCRPVRFMSDFELAITNACEEVFPTVPVSCCFFHLAQSMYRRVQGEGLQQAYNNF